MAPRAKAPRPKADRAPGATTEEVAAFLNLDKHTLENWRYLGKGPQWRKIGRGVLYDWEDVYAWYDSQRQGPSRQSSVPPVERRAS